MRVLSVMERVKLVCWFEETHSAVMTRRRYEAEFGMDPPPFSLVRKWHQHFLATGSVLPSANWNRNAGEEVLPLSAKGP